MAEGSALKALRQLRTSLGPTELCLVSRNNPYLASTYTREDNDLFDLTGFEGSSGILVVRPQGSHLFVDGRYVESARNQFRDLPVEVVDRRKEHWIQKHLQPWALRSGNRAIVHYDATRWSAREIHELRQTLPAITWKHRHFVQRQGPSQPLELTYLPDGWQDRLRRVQKRIDENDLHLLTCPDDIAWILDLRGQEDPFRRNVRGVALVGRQYAAFFKSLDPDQADRFQAKRPGWRHIGNDRLWREALATVLEHRSSMKVVIPFNNRPGAMNASHHEVLMEMAGPERVETVDRTLAELGRLEKSSQEMGVMSEHTQRTVQVMEGAIDFIHHEIGKGRGCRELQVFQRANALAHELGSVQPSFPGIVASGPYTRFPHHQPTDRRIRPGEPVMLDLGYYFDDGPFATDLTRTIVAGRDARPTPILKKVYSAVVEAFALQWATPIPPQGLVAHELDAIGRQPLSNHEEEGFTFCHGTGHGVGISDHELGITVGPSSRLRLRQGNTYSIEPGLYRTRPSSLEWENFGVRIEDVVAVREVDGEIRQSSLHPMGFDSNLLDRDLFDHRTQLALDLYLSHL